MSVRSALEQVDTDTRIQYGLMGIFGALCLLTAAAPLELLPKAVIVSVLFGFTGGIWVAHLVQIVQDAADRKQAVEGR
jgi:hypothetical protein